MATWSEENPPKCGAEGINTQPKHVKMWMWDHGLMKPEETSEELQLDP